MADRVKLLRNYARSIDRNLMELRGFDVTPSPNGAHFSYMMQLEELLYHTNTEMERILADLESTMMKLEIVTPQRHKRINIADWEDDKENW